jgi:hypothetical protein
MDDRPTAKKSLLLEPGHRIYAAGVVGLATFLSLALLLPAPIESYRAQAVIEQEADAAESDVTDLRLVSSADVDAIVQEVATSHSADAVSCQVERFTPYRVRATIETRQRYADQALLLCKEIASRVVADQPPSYVPHQDALRSQRGDVERRLALVRESKRAMEDEMASLQREHLAEFSLAMQRVMASQAVANSPAASATPSLPPEYVQLEHEFQQLLASRRELSRTRTDEHPQIRDLDERLAAARQQLDRWASAIQVPAATKEPTNREQAKLLAQLEQMQGEFRRRTQETVEAIAQTRRREEDLLSEAARLAVTPSPVLLKTTLTQPAAVVERVGGQPSLARFALYFAIALIAGLAMYSLMRQVASIRKLSSPDDVRTQLGLPVVSLMESYCVDQPGRELELVLRRSVLFAEGLLVLLMVASLALVFTQSQLTEPVGSDPFGAVAEAIDRTLQPTVKR